METNTEISEDLPQGMFVGSQDFNVGGRIPELMFLTTKRSRSHFCGFGRASTYRVSLRVLPLKLSVGGGCDF